MRSLPRLDFHGHRFFVLPFIHVLIGGMISCGPAPLSAAEQKPVDPPDDPAVEGLALLERAVQAIGDPELFDRISAVRVRGLSSSKLDPENGTYVDMLTPFPAGESPGLWMRIVSEGEDQVFDRRVAGEQSWAKGVGVLPAELHADAVRYASTKMMALLRHRQDSATEVVYEGRETVDGRVVEKVKVTLQGNESWIELDPDTARIVAVSFKSSSIQEEVEDQMVRRSYGDFRHIEDFELPFYQVVTVGGEYYNEWKIDEIDINAEFDPSIFQFETE